MAVAEKIFYRNMTIFSDTEEDNFMLKNNEFLRFIEADHHDAVLHEIETHGYTEKLQHIDNMVAERMRVIKDKLAQKLTDDYVAAVSVAVDKVDAITTVTPWVSRAQKSRNQQIE